jgi:hypothetical protein
MIECLVVLWCGAGLVAFFSGEIPRVLEPALVGDLLMAAALGPFAFLISQLAAEMLVEPEREKASTPDCCGLRPNITR